MWKIMLIGDARMTMHFLSLPLWGEDSGFEISDADESYLAAAKHIHEYELIIADPENGIPLLKMADDIPFKTPVILYGPEEYESVRRGFIHGAYDYITKALDTEQVRSILNRLKVELENKKKPEHEMVDRLVTCMESGDENFDTLVLKAVDRWHLSDPETTARNFEKLFRLVCRELTEKYPWLDLYLCEETFRLTREPGKNNPASDFVRKQHILYHLFRQLYPKGQSQLSEVFSIILNGPEDDLRLKTIASKAHMNGTYLSTVFQASTGIYFLDYIQAVKMKRAACLLLSTDLSIAEIAGRLHYKDISYFSRLFRENYGLAPSVFRIPEDYNFQI